MKRYLLFAGQDYEPGGGWHDFAGSFETTAEAEAEAKALMQRPFPQDVDWWHVVDGQTGEKVAEG